MTKRKFNKLVKIQMELIQGNLEHSQRTSLQDLNALEVSKNFYLKIVEKMTTRGRFHTSCFAAVVALNKMISNVHRALAMEADMSIDAGEFSGRFW
jgi:CTP-dependent riboflavin kinase